MVCNPNSNQLNPPILGPAPNLGFGPMFAPFNVPFPDISIPEGIPDDILGLLQDIYALIPGGKLVPNADDTFRNVLDAVASIMNQLGPYLSIYNFFQALLNMIMCIIDVLCSLTVRAPFALRRLFKRCLPDFLNLFPPFALIAMILALILLLLALIEYLIQLILAYVRDIIANLAILAEAAQFDSEQDVLAGVQKIASLLCLIEQAFALLIAFQAIFEIIQALAGMGNRFACFRGGSNDSGCCPDEYCPPFIAENENGLFGTMGRLIYHNTILQDTSGFGSFNLPPIRESRWQFVDDQSGLEFTFGNIITPINGNIYWPTPLEYNKDSSLKKVPYALDMRLFLNPETFGHNAVNGDFSGARNFRIKDVVVSSQPYFGVLNYNNSTITGGNFGNNAGTLPLTGGLVYEDDGITPVFVNGRQASLDTFIVKSPVSFMPISEDGHEIVNISYNLRFNHDYLYSQQIITLGCMPEVAHEADTLNSQINVGSVIERIGSLPDFQGTLDCLNQSLNKFRDDVSIENAAIFEGEITGCLNDLKNQSQNTYKNSLIAGVSVSESDVELEPEIQFVDNVIKLKVTLKDPGGSIISFNVPGDIQSDISSMISVIPTLGNVSDFEFDGNNSFIADLISDKPGDGNLQVYFNGVSFNSIINRDSDELDTAIEDRVFNYKFVGTSFTTAGEDNVKERRDESDVSSGGA